MRYPLKPKIRTDGCRTIVRLWVPFGSCLDESEWNQFNKQELRGFFRATRWRRRWAEFSGPVGVTLYDRFREPVTRYEFFIIMEQILILTEELQHHGLSAAPVIFDLHLSFINKITSELSFLYFPILDPYDKQGLLPFVESIVYSVIPMADDGSDYLSRFVYFLRNLSYFDISRIEQYILEEEPEAVARVRRGESVCRESDGRESACRESACRESACRERLTDEKRKAPACQAECGDIGIAGSEISAQSGIADCAQEEPAEEETCLLCNTGESVWPRLYRVSCDETIPIDRTEFRIGKDAGRADYVVADNRAVSRNHARIRREGKHFYFSDLDSKNQSYVNGEAVPAYAEREIFDRDQIRLADEEFVFCLDENGRRADLGEGTCL